MPDVGGQTVPKTEDSIQPNGRSDYANALIAEIRILVRAIANDPMKHVSDIKISWIDAAGRPDVYTYPRIVMALGEVDDLEAPGAQLQRLGLLQAVKDQLIALTAPATGLTIAYTSLVIGSQRRKTIRLGFDPWTANGLGPAVEPKPARVAAPDR